MIHMMSRFDLKDGVDLKTFREDYRAFVALMQAKGLVEETGPVGRRVADTPMDTDEAVASTYFVVMSFRDRAQMDEAYTHIAATFAGDENGHPSVHTAVTNSAFLCWDDAVE